MGFSDRTFLGFPRGLVCIPMSLVMNEFRCHEAKIEESEKAGSRRESNLGQLA